MEVQKMEQFPIVWNGVGLLHTITWPIKESTFYATCINKYLLLTVYGIPYFSIFLVSILF